MEEINLKELFLYFKKKSIIILLITLSALLIGLAYTNYFKKPLYRGEVSLIVARSDTDDNQTSSSIQSDIATSQKLVGTYREIITSKRVLNQVIEHLSLDCSVSNLMSKISVSNVNDTELIKITVSDEIKSNAAAIANRTALVFIDEIKEIYKLDNVSIIDYAEIQDNPYNINKVKDVSLFTIVGLIVSCGVVFLIFYFDNTVKSKEEIEKKLGLTVIGTVSTYNRKKAK